MSYVSLEAARKSLEAIHTADDELIQQCIDAAEDYAANYMGRVDISDGQAWKDTIEDASDESSSDGQLVPASVVRAILLLTGEYFEQRTQGVSGTIYTKMPAVEDMLHFYRVGLGA